MTQLSNSSLFLVLSNDAEFKLSFRTATSRRTFKEDPRPVRVSEDSGS